MTEAEWRASRDPEPMLRAVGALPHTPGRKLRLFGVACWYRYLADVRPAEVTALVELFVRYEDGLLTPGEWFDGFTRAGPATRDKAFGWLISTNPLTAAVELARYAKPDEEWRARSLDDRIHTTADAFARDRAARVALVRDVFGNPFAPTHFNPDWRTDTAVTLARQMYDAREFSAAPILADALQDAGCDCDELLAHLRDPSVVLGQPPTGSPKPPPATHVRGCWAVDLVLGRG